MSRIYREGVLGALMDEFERAGRELAGLVSRLSRADFESGGEDGEELSSVQKIFRHVLLAGYGHANHVRIALAIDGGPVEVPLATRGETGEQMEAMLAYMEQTLEGRWRMSDEEIEAVRIPTAWGVTYDLEQMLEHAIVHVLRHRRQIERLLDPHEDATSSRSTQR